MSAAGEVRELRAEIRHWRRGRADTSFGQAFSDAYVMVFSTVVLGSMTISALLKVRHTSTAACTSTGCLEARALLPWLVAGTGVLVVLAGARLLGPLFVSPAVASWLLPTWADRAALLRPRLLWSALVAGAVAAALAVTAAILGGFPVVAAALLAGSAVVLAIVVLCLAVASQVSHGPGARALTWVAALATWLGLLLLATGQGPVSSAPDGDPAWVVAVAVASVAALALVVRVVRMLGGVRRRDLVAGGVLAPSLSGALASLDLALVYDVLLARRWRDHPSVRSRRAVPEGRAALVWFDVVRLIRSPQLVVVLGAAVVVPYVAEEVDLGEAVVLVATLTGFMAGVGFLSALRVVERTAGLLRMLPFKVWETRLSTLVVPATAITAYGLATAPALHRVSGTPWSDSWTLALAVGLAATAGAVRWVTGRPPDYSRPLVSSPMGAVPTNLYGSAVRGFDVVFLSTAPMLVWFDSSGAVASLAISALTLTFLVTRA